MIKMKLRREGFGITDNIQLSADLKLGQRWAGQKAVRSDE